MANRPTITKIDRNTPNTQTTPSVSNRPTISRIEPVQPRTQLRTRPVTQNQFATFNNKIGKTKERATTLGSTLGRGGTSIAEGFLGRVEDMTDEIFFEASAAIKGKKKATSIKEKIKNYLLFPYQAPINVLKSVANLAGKAGIIDKKKASKALLEQANIDVTKAVVDPAKKQFNPKSAEFFKTGNLGDIVNQGVGGMAAIIGTTALLGKGGKIPVGKFNIPVASVLSGAGSGTKTGLSKGKTLEEAQEFGRLKGLLSGTIEGIGGGAGKTLGKGVVSPAITKLTERIGSKTLSALANRGLETGSEVIEELVEGILTPYLERMTIDEKAELYTGSQAREDALVTFLVTSIVQSPSNIQTIRENAAKQQTDTKVIKDNIQQETVTPEATQQPAERPRITPINQAQPTTQVNTLEDVTQRDNVAEGKPRERVIEGKPLVKQMDEIGEDITGDDVLKIENKTFENVSNRKQNLVSEQNKDLKSYIQESAYNLLDDLNLSTKGELLIDDNVLQDTKGEAGITGIKRDTSPEIELLLDRYRYTYTQITDSVQSIIDGKPKNNAITKRVELILMDYLENGFTSMSGFKIPANQDFNIQLKNTVDRENAPISEKDIPFVETEKETKPTKTKKEVVKKEPVKKKSEPSQKEMTEYLKTKLPYKDSWYEKLSDKQIKAIYNKQKEKEATKLEKKKKSKIKEPTANAVNKAIETGKFNKELVKQIRKFPQSAEAEIAMRTMKDGRKIPAIRESGIYAPKQFETHKFKDIKGLLGQQSENFLSAAGAFDNVTPQQAAKDGWGPMKQLQFEVDQSVADRNTFALEQVGLIIELAKKHGIKINKNTGNLLFTAMEETKTTPKIDALAKDIRTNLNFLREEANKVREVMGKKPIGFIENYAPHVQKVSLWREIMGDKKTEISENFDFIIPNEKKNPFAMKRINAEFDKETDMWTLLDGYINAISNDIYTTPAIEKIKAVDSVIMPTHPNMSNFLKTFNKQNLVGQAGKLDTMLGVTPGSAKRGVMTKVMRARSTSALAGNFVWSLTTQPASLANTFARAGGLKRGAQNTLGGVWDYATNKGIKNKVNKLPSQVIKTKGASIGRTGGGDVDRIASKLGKTKLDTFNDYLAIMPDAIEKFLTGASASAGYREAKAIGLTGKDADIFADQVAQNTQSMYNKEARPVIMNNITARFGAPFQTFAFEQYRYAKQLAGKGGGIPLEARERLSQAIMLLISMALFGKYAEKVAGKKINTAGTFVPIVGSVVDSGINKLAQTVGAAPREYQSSGRSPVAPLEDVKKVYESVDTAVQHGNFQPMRKELVKWGLGFGGISGASTVNRFIDGAIANNKGFQTTRSGKVAFPVTGLSEQTKALILGPYGTKAGKQYIEGGFRYLSENQSKEVEESNNPKKTFDAIMEVREENRKKKEETDMWEAKNK